MILCDQTFCYLQPTRMIQKELWEAMDASPALEEQLFGPALGGDGKAARRARVAAALAAMDDDGNGEVGDSDAS